MRIAALALMISMGCFAALKDGPDDTTGTTGPTGGTAATTSTSASSDDRTDSADTTGTSHEPTGATSESATSSNSAATDSTSGDGTTDDPSGSETSSDVAYYADYQVESEMEYLFIYKSDSTAGTCTMLELAKNTPAPVPEGITLPVGWALVEYSHTTSVDACAAACTRFPSEAEMQSIEGSVDFSVDPPFELDVDVRASFYTEGGSSFDVTLAAQMVPVGPC